jgi:hypothetical protein
MIKVALAYKHFIADNKSTVMHTGSSTFKCIRAFRNNVRRLSKYIISGIVWGCFAGSGAQKTLFFGKKRPP